MLEGLIDSALGSILPSEQRIYGVAIAQVIDNIDLSGQGRVQLSLPWLPGVEPWARVAALFAGAGYGAYCIPQPGDEVLVAFNQGDVREPFVVGCLWNALDRPPTSLPTDAVNKYIIRTQRGHEIEFDDLTQQVTITSSTQHKIEMSPESIRLTSTGESASITLGTDGQIKIQAAGGIALEASDITLDAGKLELNGSFGASLNGGLGCDIRAMMVRIN